MLARATISLLFLAAHGVNGMKNLIAAALVSLSFSGAAFADVYKMDPGHTEVRFYWNHAGLTEQSGEWGKVDGEIEFDRDNIEATKVTIEIDAASIDTGVADLDKHLRSADFFDVEKHPKITFVSTSAKQTGAKSVLVTGDLSIKDTTNPVEVDVELVFEGENPLGGFFDYYKGEWIGVHASGTLVRSDFGVGMFAPLTSDRIRLEIATEMRKGGWEK